MYKHTDGVLNYHFLINKNLIIQDPKIVKTRELIRYPGPLVF